MCYYFAMEMLADKSRYTYRYYRDRYLSEVIEPAKMKAEKDEQSFNPNSVLTENAFIYVHFVDELKLTGINDMMTLAKVLDKQLVYADEPLKDIIFEVWGQIIDICDNSTDQNLETNLNEILYDPSSIYTQN